MKTANIFRALLLVPLLFISIGAYALDEDCIQNGGKAHCTQPHLKNDWSYGVCDDVGPYVFRMALWCRVAGGTWVVPINNAFYCQAPQTLTDPLVYPWSEEFERRLYNPCTISGTDTGWGATVQSFQCYSGGTVIKNGIELRSLREMVFSGIYRNANATCGPTTWSERVIAIRTRELICPAGYRYRVAANGDIECFTPPPCEKCVGNPVDVISGAKRQSETDYASAAVGGLSFARYYNSQGFYIPTGTALPRAAQNSDYWRHSFDKRVVFNNNTYVMASAQRADGTVQYFNPQGG